MTVTQEPPVLPSLFAASIHSYQMRPANFAASFGMEALIVAAIIVIAMHPPTVHKPDLPPTFQDVSAITWPLTMQKPGGDGAGGTHEKLAASTGVLPPMNVNEQLTPPEVVFSNPNPVLPMPPSILAISTVKLPDLGALGDPHSSAAIPSNGTGGPGGIGSNCCNGVGDYNGPGFGDDQGYVYRPGRNGVTQPRVLYDPDPDYSEEARRAKFQGSVILAMIVGADGKPKNLQVQRSAGMGLDEKAIAAVNQWRFQPATLDGRPVAVRISVEVSFRLF
ncbi:MAG TPA: energy transducer TonB [Terriglobales bacterium]|jgi:TonB family protein